MTQQLEEKRCLFYAGWKVIQQDECGGMYYFYPDGVSVHQSMRRREFVTISNWRIEDNTLIIWDFQVRHPNVPEEQIELYRKQEIKYEFTFPDERTCRWASGLLKENITELERLEGLPDRTENIYWGLGNEESYNRGFRRSMGLRVH